MTRISATLPGIGIARQRSGRHAGLYNRPYQETISKEPGTPSFLIRSIMYRSCRLEPATCDDIPGIRIARGGPRCKTRLRGQPLLWSCWAGGSDAGIRTMTAAGVVGLAPGESHCHDGRWCSGSEDSERRSRHDIPEIRNSSWAASFRRVIVWDCLDIGWGLAHHVGALGPGPARRAIVWDCLDMGWGLAHHVGALGLGLARRAVVGDCLTRGVGTLSPGARLDPVVRVRTLGWQDVGLAEF